MRARTMLPWLFTSTSSLSEGSRYTFTDTRSPGSIRPSAARRAAAVVSCACAANASGDTSSVSTAAHAYIRPFPAIIILSRSGHAARQRELQLRLPIRERDAELARNAATVEQSIQRPARRRDELVRRYRYHPLHILLLTPRIERQDALGEPEPRGGPRTCQVIGAAPQLVRSVQHSPDDPHGRVGHARGRRRRDELILDHSKFLTLA